MKSNVRRNGKLEERENFFKRESHMLRREENVEKSTSRRKAKEKKNELI